MHSDSVSRSNGASADTTDIAPQNERSSDYRDREHLQQFALKSAGMGTWRYDVAVENIYLQENLDSVFGLPEGTSDGSLNGFMRLIHPDDRGHVQSVLARTLEQGAGLHMEYRIIRPDGVVRWIATQGEAHRNTEGQIDKIFGVSWDVSRQKEYEQERRYVMSKARCLLWYAEIWDSEHPYMLFWDAHIVDERAAQEFMPVDLREGESYVDARYRARLEEDRDRCDRLGTAAIRAGKSYSQEFRSYCADGTIRWMHEEIQVETVEPGKRWRAVGVCTDVDERVRAEEALIASERIARGTLDALSAHIAILDQHGVIIETNRAWKAFAIENGAPSLAHVDIGANYLAACRHTGEGEAEGAQTIARAIDAAIVGESTGFQCEYPCHTESEQRWFVARVSRFPGEGPVRVVVAHENITAQKAAEHALRESERKALLIAEAMPQIVWTARSDASVDFLNQRWHELTGQTAEEGLGFGWTQAMHPEDLARSFLSWKTAAQAGGVYEFECRYKRASDGAYRWHLDRAVPLYNERGDIILWVGTATDIEALKQKTAALQESEQRLKTALHAGNMGIWTRDLRTNEVTWSAETYRLFGVEHEEFQVGVSSFERFVHPDDLVGIREASLKAIANHTPYEQEYRITRPDGTVAWMMNKGAAFYDQAGQPIRMMGVVADITERKRLEAQFLQAQKMDGIGRLAGGIAHDFNNLLSVILGYAEMVEMELPQESELRPNVQNIHNAATRAAKLTAQLLAFARRQVSAARVIRPNEVIAGMSPILKPLIRENIELKTLLDADAGSVKADPTQIEQVIVNLVVNARDAIVGSGKIFVQTENAVLPEHFLRDDAPVIPGEYVVIAVSDTGSGMTDEVKNRLFEPFFTTKGVGKGTGLGLSTVYGIVKQSGGYVFVYSEVGVGTTMKVYLPRTENKDSSEPDRLKANTGLRGTETILVVEDEALVRDLTVTTLKRNGYTVLQAANGREALEVAEKYTDVIHLLVSDAIMPEMGGKEMADRLKDLRPITRALFVSGYTEEVTSAQGILPEGTAFLQKPFTANGLLNKVREELDRA